MTTPHHSCRPITQQRQFRGARGVPNVEKQNTREEQNFCLTLNLDGNPSCHVQTDLATDPGRCLRLSRAVQAMLFICSKGRLETGPCAPFPRLFSFSRLDSPCCCCEREDDGREAQLGGSSIQPDGQRLTAFGKTSHSTTSSPVHLQGTTRRKKKGRTELKLPSSRSGFETSDTLLGEPTSPSKPMRDARRCSGTGSEDFQGSVIVRWKVLLSPRCTKRTYPRKQVRGAGLGVLLMCFTVCGGEGAL